MLLLKVQHQFKTICSIMSKQKFYIVVIIGLLISNLLLIGFMFPKRGHKPPAKGMKLDGPRSIIIEKLKFDDVQVASYDELIEVHQTNIKEQDEQIFAIKNGMYKTLNESDAKLVDSLSVEIASAQKAIEVLHYNHFLDIKKLCKPEQLKDYEMLTKDIAKLFSRKPKGKKRK